MSGTQSLLMEYANGGSENAFRELVTAYVDFVFSTALRIVGGDRPLAEDVTQTVFADLAWKAVSLPRDVQLGGWLHRHTCFVARKTLRKERRRIAREKRVVEFQNAEDYSESNLAQLSLVLDEAINDLSKEDRNALTLRFFEERDFRSIGKTLGTSEDAARMRVSRAVDKIGRSLKRRGFVLTAAGIGFVLSGTLASAAPAGLATRIIYVELARAIKTSSIFRILKEACFTRLNVGVVTAAIILGLLVLLISPRRTGARALPDPDGKTFTPAEFAGLAVEEADEQNAPQPEVVSPRTEISPAPTLPPAQVVVASRRPVTIPAKPVAVNQPPPQPTQVTIQPTPTANGGGETIGSPQWNQIGNSSGQGTRKYVPPSVTPQSRPATNNSNSILVSNSPSLNSHNPNSPTQPWSMTRAMAAAEPGSTAQTTPANQPSVQSMRSVSRNAPSSRSNDPRKRDRQP